MCLRRSGSIDDSEKGDDVELSHLEPSFDAGTMVGWSARFTDDSGHDRLAAIPLNRLLDPAAFSQVVARQGVQYTPPGGDDRPSWQNLIQRVRRR
jgi:hypothetical protein